MLGAVAERALSEHCEATGGTGSTWRGTERGNEGSTERELKRHRRHLRGH